MDKSKKAIDFMTARQGNCAQATFTAFCEDYGLNKETAFNLAQGFGGGIHMGSTCGAVTGAYMALGLANPIDKENPRQSGDKLNALTAEFNRKFLELHGSLNCTGLLGYDLSKPEEATQAREKGLFTSKCPVFVSDAVKIVEKLLK